MMGIEMEAVINIEQIESKIEEEKTKGESRWVDMYTHTHILTHTNTPSPLTH
jgi:hypothetical protein